MNTSPLRPALSASGRMWFLLGLIVLFVGLSVQYSVKVLHNRGAFNRWEAAHYQQRRKRGERGGSL